MWPPLFTLVLSLLICTACHHPIDETQYFSKDTDPPFIIFFVEANHLDYSNCHTLVQTIAKHPNHFKRGGTFGHAWIHLEGMVDGRRLYIAGGHSGELGIVQPKYFDGLMNYIDYGYANPSQEEKLHPIYEPNPIKYLHEELKDGFFQEGSGKHTPTFAAKIILTQEQFNRIYNYILHCYPFETYSLTGNQCTSFVAQVAALAGLELECEITLNVEKTLYFNRTKMTLWHDPAYKELTFASPDLLEKSLIQAVKQGKAHRL